MLGLACLLALFAATAFAQDAAAPARPGMRQLQITAGLPPSPRDLVDARTTLKARFREPLSHADTAVGAMQAADLLYAAAINEGDASLKWLMLDESRKLAINAGRAEAVSRAITLASATYEFDALALELKSLGQIPLAALDPTRATRLAQSAETLATRAETDGRPELAEDALLLAYRTWQRSGNIEAARRTASRMK